MRRGGIAQAVASGRGAGATTGCTARAGVAEAVIELILQVKPGRELPDPTPGETRLDSAGLDLDSVEIVEILVGCEERFGRSAAAK